MDAGPAVVFVHVYKAAGSSLRLNVLEPRFAPEASYHVIGDGRGTVDALAAFDALPEERRRSLRFVQGHIHYGVHAALPQGARYLTVLRDPVERVVSKYFFVLRTEAHRQHDWLHRDGVTLADWAEHQVTLGNDNFQVRQLAGERHLLDQDRRHPVTPDHLEAALANLERFDAVGLAEQYEESVALFSRVFGWERAEPGPARNVSEGRPAVADLDAGTVERVRAATTFDAVLYGAARRRFARDTLATPQIAGRMADRTSR